MSKIEVTVPVADVRAIREVLQGVLNYFQADQIMRAQRMLTDARTYPIAEEIERMHARVTNILGEHLIQMEDMPDEEVVEPVEVPEMAPRSQMLLGPDLTRRVMAREASDEDVWADVSNENEISDN